MKSDLITFIQQDRQCRIKPKTASQSTVLTLKLTWLRVSQIPQATPKDKAFQNVFCIFPVASACHSYSRLSIFFGIHHTAPHQDRYRHHSFHMDGHCSSRWSVLSSFVSQNGHKTASYESKQRCNKKNFVHKQFWTASQMNIWILGGVALHQIFVR